MSEGIDDKKEKEASPDIEEKAKQMGFVPKDEWKGDPDKWRPAEEYVERGENIIPIMRKQIEDLRKEQKVLIGTQNRERERIKKEEFEKAKVSFERKQAELDDKEAEAIVEQDSEAIKKIRKEKRSLKQPEPDKKDVTDQQNDPPPEFKEWHKTNPWYSPDPYNMGADADLDATLQANSYGAYLQGKNPDMPPEEFYAAIGAHVKKTFPDKFSNKNRDKATIAGEGTHTTVGKTKKSFADIPNADKNVFKRLKKNVERVGGKLTEEDYAKDYFGEE